MSNEAAIALLRRWRDAALNDDASTLADLTNDATEVLDNLEPVDMGEPDTREPRWRRDGWHTLRCFTWWVGEPEYANCICDEAR